MAQILPRMRNNLDLMPSPLPDRPGLLIRDPFHYSETTLIIPPALVECLECFDGRHSGLDLRAILVRLTGDIRVGDLERHLVHSLEQAGFLEDPTFEEMREKRHKAFAETVTRVPAHAGSAYPSEPDELRATMARYLDGAIPSTAGNLAGIAAPHVSPEGGWRCYQAAYGALGPRYKDRTFLILGTSHYGDPERFGLTRKPFSTPFGETASDLSVVDRLAAEGGPAVKMEDYCHSVEHSIEFQVVFLQHLYGPGIRVVPILCGPYARAILRGGLPEDDENVRRFLGALAELAAREGERLFWVLGVDMAHMGRRYGDPFGATADRGAMAEVAEADRLRINRINDADSRGFWEAVQEKRDALKWCGSSPFYTFLKAVPEARGKLLAYEQWNIDEQSVVSFGALAFER